MTRRRNFREICPNASPLALDFLKRTLTFSPTRRMTVHDALDHPYLEAYHDLSDEPSARKIEPEFFYFNTSDKEEEYKNREVLKRELLPFVFLLVSFYAFVCGDMAFAGCGRGIQRHTGDLRGGVESLLGSRDLVAREEF